jgi:hypothetical protein
VAEVPPQGARGVGVLALGERGGWTLGDDAPAPMANLGAKVDEPVRLGEEVEGAADEFRELGLATWRDFGLADGQIDAVLAEAVQARPLAGGDGLSVDAQHELALAVGPARQLRVVALTGNDQRGHDGDVPSGKVGLHAREDGLPALRADCDAAPWTMLDPELPSPAR